MLFGAHCDYPLVVLFYLILFFAPFRILNLNHSFTSSLTSPLHYPGTAPAIQNLPHLPRHPAIQRHLPFRNRLLRRPWHHQPTNPLPLRPTPHRPDQNPRWIPAHPDSESFADNLRGPRLQDIQQTRRHVRQRQERHCHRDRVGVA